MPRKKEPKDEQGEQPQGPPSLGDLATKDLLRSIRDDLAQQAKRAALDQSPDPPKQRPKR